jgi:hypothetical protein
MSSAEPLTVTEWREHNGAYLRAALDWLRVLLVAAADDRSDESPVQDALHRVREAEASVPPPALMLLSAVLGLTRFESDLLLLCAAMELDTRMEALCRDAHGDPRRPYPTFALAMAVFDEADWSALAPEGALRSWRLVEPVGEPDQPLILRPLQVDERVVHFAKGLNVLDQRVARLLRPVEPASGGLMPSQVALAEQLAAALDGDAGGFVQLVGANRASKRSIATDVAGGMGLDLYELAAASLPAGAADAHELARLWQRESLLLPVALLVAADDEPLTAAQSGALKAIARNGSSPTFLSVAEACADLAEVSAVREVSTPTPSEQRALWGEVLGGEQLDLSARLASEFDLDTSEIERVAREAKRSGDGDLARGAWDCSMAISRPNLDSLAQRLRPVATWDDIVLPAEPARLLRSIAVHASHRGTVYDEWGWRERSERGLGITALFAGESGTGKTMAAEVLANDLGLDLYRIDLSGVVSKYVGETEKNLRRLFDAAEHGGVVLFFDEADALFGKRTEVRDSHDRYANIEVNYLLQRMESYRGLAILATNMRSALDPAFTRRLRFIVPFAFPGRSERERIWQRVFPGGVPTAGLDATRLARLNLSGALIHAVALQASFTAAAEGGPVTMDMVLGAARTELRKADRSTNEVEAV